MAGIAFGSIAAFRRTTNCIRLLRFSYHSRDPSFELVHQRRRRHNSSSKSGESEEGKNPNRVGQDLGEGKALGNITGGLETAAEPPDQPKTPGERSPECPYESKPEILPLQDQPNRAQPSPAVVKPPNPQTIVCSLDSKDLSGTPKDVLGRKDLGKKFSETKDLSTQITSTPLKDDNNLDNLFAIESELKSLAASISDYIVEPNHQTLFPIKSEIKSTDLTSNGFSTEASVQCSTSSIDLPPENTFLASSQLKSQDSNLAKAEVKSISESSNSQESLPLNMSQNSITSEDNSSKNQVSNDQPLNHTSDDFKLGSTSKSPGSGESFHLKVTPSPLHIVQTEKSTQISTFNMPQEEDVSGNSVKLICRNAEFGLASDKGEEKKPEKVIPIKHYQTDKNVIMKWVELHKTKERQKEESSRETESNERIPAPLPKPYFRKMSVKKDNSSESQDITAIETKSPGETPAPLPKPYFRKMSIKKENTLVSKDTTSTLQGQSPEGTTAPLPKPYFRVSASKNTMSEKKGNALVSKDTTSSPSGKDITKTAKISPKLQLPIKIVAKNEAPTEFRKTMNSIPSTELKSTKNTKEDTTSQATMPIKLTPSKPLVGKSLDSNTWKSSLGDSNISNAMVNSEKQNVVAIGQQKTKSQTTEEIVAMFKEENDTNQTKSEEAPKESKTDPFTTVSSASDKKGDEKPHSGKKADDHFSKLGHLDSTVTDEEAIVKNKEVKAKESFASLGNLDSTIREESSEKAKKNNDYKDTEIKNESKDKQEGKGEDDKNVERKRFNLAQKVSTFMKSAEEDGNRTNATQKSQRVNKTKSEAKSKLATTSELTPSDLYDPITQEISSPAGLETGKTDMEEAEESSPSLEAPEVKPKKEEVKAKAPTALDETKTKVEEKVPVKEPDLKKERPKLDDGELSLKLLDKVTGETPAVQIPAESKPPAEKSLIQHFFDKIFGRDKSTEGKSTEGKRKMSSYTGRRHLSTSSLAAFSTRGSILKNNNKPKVSKSWERTFLRRRSPYNLSIATCLIEAVLEPSKFELFAKNDDTEIKGGSPECCSPKKTPRELLREGGSEECAQKMKRLNAKDNLTAVLYGKEDLRLEQRPIPEIADDEVLLAMDSVGICGSDVHYLVHGRIGDFVLTKPMVIGHESAGVVTKLGKKVTNLKIGDRVAIEPGVPCRYCDHCKQGRYNLCPGMVFCATPPYDGNLTRYYKHPADFCFKLPDHVSMEEGALLEPLSVGVHACKRAEVTLGSKVLILGAGPIGLVTLMAAQAMGASEILITDLLQQRLNVAKELGATHTLLLKQEQNAEETAELVKKTLGVQPDKSIDCCGAESSARLAIFATKSGGIVVVVGMGAAEVKLPLINALTRELDIRGVFRYCNDYAAALALVASGKVNVKRLVTHHFDIKETAKAFETSRKGLGGAIKVMIHVQPRDTNNPCKF
ncbi:uncharacterized protein LOC108116215 isoform X3 [Drosophila eugracilis]|uniref:uncharacterized protein LOC108116215 isoform X3 n=1 Tax=Drosophila eugracilis TaxID=29029 RepID=UPI001BDB28C2|nr:uncharacterized protein LOC108116215 isoform X3 [Drosophila eugracilis]